MTEPRLGEEVVADLIDAIKNADPSLCGACGETFQNGHACPVIERAWEQGRQVGQWEVAARVGALADGYAEGGMVPGTTVAARLRAALARLD